MRFLLRHFPAFQQLQRDLDAAQSANRELQTENSRLSDRLEAAIEDRAKLFALVTESIRNERAGYQAQINFQSQRSGAPAPFAQAAQYEEGTLPTAEQKQPVARRLLPSEMIAHAHRDFINRYVAEHAPKGNS